jgi:hypothetical protein
MSFPGQKIEYSLAGTFHCRRSRLVKTSFFRQVRVLKKQRKNPGSAFRVRKESNCCKSHVHILPSGGFKICSGPGPVSCFTLPPQGLSTKTRQKTSIILSSSSGGELAWPFYAKGADFHALCKACKEVLYQ